MYHRDLGKTGFRVSEIGMGCNRLGEDYAPVDHWVRLVQRAADLGVTLFDTAEAYGWGRSEEMLGLALGNRTDVMIATKMCRIRETDESEYSAARMMLTAESSLRRLRRDVIDIYQLHSPRREHLERFDWAEGMARLKQQGKIRLAAVAIGANDDGIWLMEQGLVDVLQITYNILEPQAAARLLPLAQERGVGLLCRMPLARGVLTGKFRLGEPVAADHRAALDGARMWDNVAKAEALRPLAEAYPGGMTRLAHHYALTPRAISAIIPGARTLAQLEENVAASNGVGLPPELAVQIEAVRAAWA